MRKHKLKQITFLDGIALGAFCATILFLVAFMVLDLPLGEDAWIGFLGNMIVAGFSIGAAFIALRGNRLQIAQANDIEDERRHNSLIAARAVLPAILADLSRVARNNLMLRFQPGHALINFDVPAPTAFQDMPDTVIPGLKECIEHADGVSQDRLANILRHFQVLQARQIGVAVGAIEPGDNTFPVPVNEAISDAIGWAVIYALIDDAYPFARGTARSIPATLKPNRVHTAFAVAGVVVDLYPNLEETLNRRIAEGRLEREWHYPPS